jgi:hypothetical protein
MKHLLVCLLLLPAFLGLCPSSWASWKFISTGTATAVGTPSCAQLSTSHVVCAVRTGKAGIMVNGFNGTSWHSWTTLAGTVSSDPSCTSDGNGNVICAATATSGSLLWTRFNGTTWTTPLQVTASLFSTPSCANYTVGQVLCVARNASGGLAYTIYNGVKWSTIANLAITAISQPGCTTDNNAGVICAVYTSAGATEVNRYTAGHWQGFLNIGGIAGGAPDCTSMNDNGNVVCFAEGYISGIYGNRFKGPAWTTADWTGYSDRGLGGSVTENASCTSQSANKLACGVMSVTDDAFYADVWNGTSWSGWTRIGSSGTGSPSCAPLGTGQVVCIFMGLKNQLTSVVGP